MRTKPSQVHIELKTSVLPMFQEPGLNMYLSKKNLTVQPVNLARFNTAFVIIESLQFFLLIMYLLRSLKFNLILMCTLGTAAPGFVPLEEQASIILYLCELSYSMSGRFFFKGHKLLSGQRYVVCVCEWEGAWVCECD